MSGHNSMSVARIAVFIDYQNCYGAAREAFHDPKHDPVQWGNIRPKALALLLAGKGGRHSDLAYVGVYICLPDATLDPQTNRARLKQIAAWEAAGVRVVSRPLRYPPKWSRERPEEKGIDVKLAIDAVMMAVRDQYDIAILASTDTDLVPVAEALLELRGNQASR